ncbi:hypothetical protein KC19_2G204300 [Ceratodon purpureus]|uniref:Cation efflux protein cytoplasmic domain-containing protein n=1 Tax=Ceratodon purpureus TaxID=3225 RepID=A0A8T0IYZ8_CERPU|nr:hypothetical protein KC19_2G204300 [Ceratodon purpureus]
MPLRSSYGFFSRRSCCFFGQIEDMLWTESKPVLIRPSEILRTWKCQSLPLVRTFSSSCALDSSAQPREGSWYFSGPAENKDEINCRETISSSSSSRDGEKQIFYVTEPCDGGVRRSVTHVKQEISPSRPKPTYSFSSSEHAKAAMHGWNVSISKITGSENWRQIWSDGRRTHMGHAHDHDVGQESQEQLGAYGQKVLRWGLWTDILLTVGKGAAGYVSGSTAIIADAAHSASDIVLSGVALWTSRAANAPPDKQHPYGHGKIETMGALSISALLLATGGGIAWSAIDALQVMLPAMLAVQDTVQTTVDTVVHLEVPSHGHDHDHGLAVGHSHSLDMEHMGVALVAAIGSIGAKESLYWVTKAAGEKAGSALLKASAWHHRSDAISSIVALIGVGGAMMGIPLLDPVAALLVSGMIVKAGLQTGYQSMQELLDMGLPESVLSPIRETVLQVDGVEGIHQLRGRRMGSTVHLDVHIEVDPWLSLSAAHNIGEAVRQQVHILHPNVTESFVHIDPADGRPTSLAPGEMEIENLAADRDSHGRHGDYHVNKNQPSSGHHDENTHEHHHDNEGNDERLRDLTGTGPKAELLASDDTKSPGGTMSMNGHGVFHDNIGILRQSEVERIVRYVLHANFREAVKVKNVTCHFLHGRVVAELGVSLDPNLSIRDAMEHASDIETCLLRNVGDLSAVSVHLNLSGQFKSSSGSSSGSESES